MESIDCLIIAGGEYTHLPPEWSEVPYVIACDRGYEYATRMGLDPDIIIGDFDSSPYPSDSSAPVIKLPVQKDDTDTMFAIKYAMEHGYKSIAICAALGGRFDHSFSNIQSAMWVVRHGGECTLAGADGTMISVFAGGGDSPVSDSVHLFKKREDFSFSVFSLTESSTGVTIRGSGYDGEEFALTSDFPLGVSNHWEADFIEVSAVDGILMAVESPL